MSGKRKGIRLERQASGQMSTDDFEVLETLHQTDVAYFHKDCDGRTVVRSQATAGQISTTCSVCGMNVLSSRSALYVSQVRTDGP